MLGQPWRARRQKAVVARSKQLSAIRGINRQIVKQPLVIALIAVPILIQVYLNAGIAYLLSRRLGVAWCVRTFRADRCVKLLRAGGRRCNLALRP